MTKIVIFKVENSRNDILSIIIMAIILALFIGLCWNISIDFDENHVIQPKNSALNRHIKQKSNF